MNTFEIILLISLFICICIIFGINIIALNRRKKQVKPKQDILKNLEATIEGLQKQKEELQVELIKIQTETNSELKARRQKIDETIALLEEKKKIVELSVEDTILNKQQIIDTRLKAYYEKKLQEYDEKTTEDKFKILDYIQEDYDYEINKYKNQLAAIKQELMEQEAKRNAINEQLRRQKEIEEAENYHRICLSDSDKNDIQYLLSIAPNIRNQQLLYKLIWSEYIQKPFNTMLRNVLGATEPKNVIYIITNIKTKENYIGKTKAEVSKRWTEHIKSSLSIGTLSSARIHDALFKHWDEFSFNILERVPDNADLNAREKYYIDFYKSNVYGYNIKAGG